MNSYLFAWNPKLFDWSDLHAEIHTLERTGHLEVRWSCGTSRSIKEGSRFFLIRLGIQPKGLVGSGRIESRPFEAAHWREKGRRAFYVRVDFDHLQDLPLVQLEELGKPPFSAFRWTIQSSGVRIPDHVAGALEHVWAQRTGNLAAFLPEEVLPGQGYQEGSVRQITVNAYERNPEARRACLSHYGETCMACGFRFPDAYQGGEKVALHVHHLVPLHEIGGGYVVDPIKDLRPLCPNCHTMAHSHVPPYAPDELKSLVRFAWVKANDT